MTIHWQKLIPGLLLLLAGTAMAMSSSVQVWTEVTTEGELWAVLPHIKGPAGSALRYEMVTKKSGRSGTTNTRQSGNVLVNTDGSGTLAQLKIGVGPDDQCDIDIKVYDGNTLTASLDLHLPY
jgi:hypothetical protein